MQTKSKEPWYNHNGGTFKGDEPFFYDTKDFPWVERLESQWQVIREEMRVLVQEHTDSLTPYPNLDMTSRPNKWKTFGFKFWTIKSPKHCKQCPKTWELLQGIPNAIAGSFSLLEPGTTIKPHRGDTDAIIRCHLGLDIPAPLPECGFRVGDETRTWEDGKLLMFCDAQLHTAWNNTNQKRYVMIIDIMRPEYGRQAKKISSNVLAAIVLEVAYQRSAFLRRFRGRRGKAVLHRLLTTSFQAALFTRLPISLPS